MNALIIAAVAIFCNAGGDCVQAVAPVPSVIDCASVLNNNRTIQLTDDVTYYQVESQCVVVPE